MEQVVSMKTELVVTVTARHWDDRGKQVGDMCRLSNNRYKYTTDIKNWDEVTYFLCLGFRTPEFISEDFGLTMRCGDINIKIIACNDERIPTLRIAKEFIQWWIDQGFPESVDVSTLTEINIRI